MYVDGTLVSTGGANTANTTPIQFGARASSFFFPGSLDQIRLFNKTLTPMEVASLYTETTPLEEPLATLVDPFKDGSGKALYRLEGNALDESGNHNGTPTSVTWGNGISGRCGVFNGSSSQIPIASPTIPVTISSPFSISVWAKVTALNARGDIFSKESRFNINTSNTTGTITQANRICFSAVATGSVWVKCYADADVTIGVYTHIVAQWTGSVLELYVNGTKQTLSPSLTTFYALGTGNEYIGALASANYFNGNIDQVRVLNRTLTLTEIQTLYTKGA